MVIETTRDAVAENRALLTAFVEAVQRGDVPALLEMVSEDLVWTVPGRSFAAGEHRGVGNVLAVLARLGEASGGTWRVAEAEVVPSDDGGFLICRTVAEREGVSIEYGNVMQIRIEDGKIVEGRDNFSDQYAVDAFWNHTPAALGR
jgi:ketosteroid isomerase-like protein